MTSLRVNLKAVECPVKVAVVPFDFHRVFAFSVNTVNLGYAETKSQDRQADRATPRRLPDLRFFIDFFCASVLRLAIRSYAEKAKKHNSRDCHTSNPSRLQPAFRRFSFGKFHNRFEEFSFCTGKFNKDPRRSIDVLGRIATVVHCHGRHRRCRRDWGNLLGPL